MRTDCLTSLKSPGLVPVLVPLETVLGKSSSHSHLLSLPFSSALCSVSLSPLPLSETPPFIWSLVSSFLSLCLSSPLLSSSLHLFFLGSPLPCPPSLTLCLCSPPPSLLSHSSSVSLWRSPHLSCLPHPCFPWCWVSFSADWYQDGSGSLRGDQCWWCCRKRIHFLHAPGKPLSPQHPRSEWSSVFARSGVRRFVPRQFLGLKVDCVQQNILQLIRHLLYSNPVLYSYIILLHPCNIIEY